MLCPRDNSKLEVVHRAEGHIEIDSCSTCGGVWVDSHELASLCPTAAHLPERKAEALLSELARTKSLAVNRNLGRCLRCDRAPFELVLAGVAIDFCEGCGGVWIDGGEVAAIVRDPPEERKVEMPSGSPFRAAAAELAAEGKALCSACSKRVDPVALYARGDGFVCVACWAKEAGEDAHATKGTLLRALTGAVMRAFARG